MTSETSEDAGFDVPIRMYSAVGDGETAEILDVEMWQSEIDDGAEQVLLSDQAKQERQDEIMEMETQVRDLQKKRFGAEGDLFKRRQDLVRPIQEQVYGAIEEYAGDRGYDFIFDKGGSTGIIFSSDEYDKTDDIKRKVSGS